MGSASLIIIIIIIITTTTTTHANGSRVSIAIISLCVWFYYSVCPHDKTKMAETEIAELGTEIVHRDTLPINEY